MILPVPSFTSSLSPLSHLPSTPLVVDSLPNNLLLAAPLSPAANFLNSQLPPLNPTPIMSLADAVHAASHHMETTHHPDWVFPLLLSCMAGASTCVGAAVVFCFSPQQIQQSMSFSLSLAASVMITVSVISIAPECWKGIIVEGATETMVNWWLLLERLVAFGLGCGGYVLLSKLLATIPDPEHLFLSSSSKGNKDDTEHTFTFDDEVSYEELRDAPAGGVKRERRLSIDSYMSGDSFDSFYNDEDFVEDDIEMTTSADLSPSKSTNDNNQTHRMRRKMTTQSTNHSSNDHLNGLRQGTSHDIDLFQEDLEPYDKDATAKQQKQRSWRVAMLLFFSLLAHNFPEGLCVAASAKESPQLGMTVAIGIFIHNVPEGIAISVPCIAARPDAPWLAFWLASISGLAEPIGAIVALLVLQNTKLELENVLATVAGVMIMVAIMELYPEAIQQLKQQQQQAMQQMSNGDGKKQPSPPSYRSIVLGTVVGMAMMIATEWYLPA